MKMKRYGVMSGLPEKNRSRGLHKAFNKGGITILLKSSKWPQIKNCVHAK